LALEGGDHLRTHGVVARADAHADDRVERAGGYPELRAQAPDGDGQARRRQGRATRVDHRDGTAAREGDRKTVRGAHDQRRPRLGREQGVACPDEVRPRRQRLAGRCR